MAPPLFPFGCIWINRNGLTSFCFGKFVVLIYKERKLKLKNASSISVGSHCLYLVVKNMSSQESQHKKNVLPSLVLLYDIRGVSKIVLFHASSSWQFVTIQFALISGSRGVNTRENYVDWDEFFRAEIYLFLSKEGCTQLRHYQNQYKYLSFYIAINFTLTNHIQSYDPWNLEI